MAHVQRLAGAVLALTDAQVFLVGDVKQPCDFEAAGFMPIPGDRQVLTQPYILLEPLRTPQRVLPALTLDLEGEALAQRLVDALVIMRNGSISERLWRLIMLQSRTLPDGSHDARWLGVIPSGLWDMVRDQVLRCS
jgi:hypothetical protein